MTNRDITKWLDEKRIMRIQLPGNSSDLNPLENLWAVIKKIGDFSSRDVLSECEREGRKIDQTREDTRELVIDLSFINEMKSMNRLSIKYEK